MRENQPQTKRLNMNTSKIGISLAFLVVLIVWSTTPLAIQWSSVDAPFTSALLRMVIGVLFCLLALSIMTTKLPFHAAARRVYAFSGAAIFINMSLFYAAAQLIPSGWIAVLFGLSPIFTGLFSALVEPETRLTPARIGGILLGFGGLYLVFSAGLNAEDASLAGIACAVIATILASGTSVVTRQLVKPLDLSGMQISTGSLLVAVPLFALTAWLAEPTLDLQFTNKAAASILYLGLVGTGIGFTLYYYLLKHISASRIALISLITPISALSVGSWLNNEPLVAEVWLGASMVCIGLLLYQFKPKLGLRKL